MFQKILFALTLSITAYAQNAVVGKVAVFNVQGAIVNTREGHQAFSALEAKYAPRKAELDKKQADIGTLQDQLRKSATTMTAEAQRKLAREIDAKTKEWNFQVEASQGDYEEEQADISQRIVQKLRLVVDKYAKDNGITAVLDIGNPQTPAFWWATATDVTNDIVRAYDAAYPAAPAPHTGPADGI